MTDRLEYTVSGSTLTFLFSDCKRCFQLQVRHGVKQVLIIPGVCRDLDRVQRLGYHDESPTLLDKTLPAGTLNCLETKVRSRPIDIAGTGVTLVLSGTVDCLMMFDRDDDGVADFKSSTPAAEHAEHYSPQLHCYAWALESPAEGFAALDSVSRIGLACIEPISFDAKDSPDSPRYTNHRTWIEVKRNDDLFAKFLHEVARVLEMPLFPPTDGCDSCKREVGIRDLLAGTNAGEPSATVAESAMRTVLHELRESRHHGW